MSRFYRIIFACAISMFMVSCHYEPLCYNHSEHALRYHINVKADYRCDWEELNNLNWQSAWPEDYIPYDNFRPTLPDGLRVIPYNESDNYNIHNLKPEGGMVNLYEGKNDILFYNNDTEYIVISSTGATTRATTRTRTRSTYLGNAYANEDEPTLSPPDMLYANYSEDYVAEKVSKPVDFEVTLQPLVFKYKIRYEFKEGLEYVALARGVLSGMASSVTLNTGQTSDDAASLLYDCELTDYGVRAVVNSFGVPSYPNPNYLTRVNQKHGLNLEVMLLNGKTLVFEFDVTEQVKAQPHGGVIVVDDIVITKEEGTQGSGSFDVDVDDWGDYEDVILPL